MTQLYDQDFYLWVESTVQQLRQKQLDKIDWENLIEEIESLGKSEKNALKSNLRILLMHLLKWQYQPNKRSNSWSYTITEHNIRINQAFKDSPSLKCYFAEIFEDCYQDARKLAAKETGLNIKIFPLDCPFSQEDVLNSDRLTEE
ncbi:MAG: DUF29 domain-containing protein [Xenococcaceae cyanobacterium MO_188.B29]|nr:DUF29 domain-containing protein [Xenococcaceae cyanobacterium MO_188.B29]